MTKTVKTEEKTKIKEMPVKTTNEMVISVEGEEGRIHRFSSPFYSPLPECYTAAINAANEIARLFNEAVEKQKNKKEDTELPQQEETKELEETSEIPEATD